LGNPTINSKDKRGEREKKIKERMRYQMNA
jgi:hypothetical protein